MTHDFWSTLCIPGGCPALFVPQWSEVEQPGFLLRWHWLSGGGYDSALDQLTWGTEIVEAYYDTIDIISDSGLAPPRGLRLFPADRDGVERRHIRIGGGSLGLPFLLGALCFSKQVLWPSLTLAWGVGLERSYVAKLLNLTLLAPRIVEAAVRGQEPDGLSAHRLREGVEAKWDAQ